MRLDLFSRREGDLDMTLEGETLERSLRSWSLTMMRSSKRSLSQVPIRFAYSATATTKTHIDCSRRMASSARQRLSCLEMSRNSDYADRMAGVLDVDITVDAPVGSIIRMLKIKSMDLNHEY